MAWWTIGASLFASNIGTEHFVGQAGSASGTVFLPTKHNFTSYIFLPYFPLSPVYIFSRVLSLLPLG
jgi:hypothetical protein